MEAFEIAGRGARALLVEFCTEQQIPMDGQMLGVEFEADGYRVLLVPDPRDDQHLLIDVDIMPLDEISGDLLLALHQLNNQARIEHDWVASIDLSHRLCLHTHRSLTGLNGADIQSILVDGVARADALEHVCRTLIEPVSPSDEARGETISAPGLMIRG